MDGKGRKRNFKFKWFHTSVVVWENGRLLTTWTGKKQKFCGHQHHLAARLAKIIDPHKRQWRAFACAVCVQSRDFPRGRPMRADFIKSNGLIVLEPLVVLPLAARGMKVVCSLNRSKQGFMLSWALELGVSKMKWALVINLVLRSRASVGYHISEVFSFHGTRARQSGHLKLPLKWSRISSASVPARFQFYQH